ncbi:MAG TPA: hypothetical protein VFW96_10325 [Thermomicrobiales bacterium]|nr:hypothetical protein [Thermomicrobiales bacterium]
MDDLRERLRRLPAPEAATLRLVAGAALARGLAPYLVGGAVRDLLLGQNTVDLDVVVAGDAVALAAALAAETGAAVRVHERFRTATLAWPDGRQFDLVTARWERYPVPGALPEVVPGTLDDDLRRRDFTVSAMAASLDPATYGALVDPCGGLADLRAGAIRALHPASFRDDPTRLLRAVRYEQRLSALARAGDAATPRPPTFAMEPRTLAWFRDAVAAGAARTLTVERLAHEFVRLLDEPAAAPMLARLADLGLLPQISPELRWDDETRRALADLASSWLVPQPPYAAWMARCALLLAHLPPGRAADAARALRLEAAAVGLAAQVAALREQSPALTRPLANSALANLLDPYSVTALGALAALEPDPTLRAQVAHYLAELRDLKPALTGDALRALGVPPGPIYRDALAALKDHKRDHPALTVAEEERFLRAWLAARGVGVGHGA